MIGAGAGPVLAGTSGGETSGAPSPEDGIGERRLSLCGCGFAGAAALPAAPRREPAAAPAPRPFEVLEC